MSDTWRYLEGLTDGALETVDAWMHAHLKNQEENLAHAKRHAASQILGRDMVSMPDERDAGFSESDLAAVDSMVLHYIGEVDRMRCLISELLHEFARRQRR